MCVLRDSDEAGVEVRIRWLNRSRSEWIKVAEDLDSLLLHRFELLLKCLNPHLILLIQFLELLHAIMLREITSRESQIALAASHFDP